MKKEIICLPISSSSFRCFRIKSLKNHVLKLKGQECRQSHKTGGGGDPESWTMRRHPTSAILWLPFPTKLQRFYFSPTKFKDHSEGQNATKGEQSKEFLRQPNIRAMQLFAKSTDTISLEYQLSITKLWFISSGKVKNVIIDFLRNTCYNLLNINYLSSNSDLYQALSRSISCRCFCKKFEAASKI